MALPGLLLLGVLGGAAYLYKNREARDRARLFAQDLADAGVSKLPPKYSDKIYEFRRGGKPSSRIHPETGNVFEGDYTPRPEGNNPSPPPGGI